MRKIGKSNYENKARSDMSIFKFGLRFKLLSLVVIVSLLSILIATFVLFNYQHKQLIESTQSSAAALSKTIEASLHHGMIVNDWSMVNDIVHAMIQEPEVESVRLLDTRGIIVVSSFPDEIGTQFNPNDPKYLSWHTNVDQLDQTTMISELRSSSGMLVDVHVIKNQAECKTCHNPEIQTLGLLIIELPMTALYNQLMTSIWITVLAAIGALVFMTGLMIPAINRLVIRPVQELIKGVDEIGSDNLDFRVAVNNKDELGKLAESFNSMQDQLANTYAKMERREQELAILNDVAFAATQLLDLQECMHLALKTVVSQLRMETGFIYLFDETLGCCTLWASHGIPEEQVQTKTLCSQPCGFVSRKGIKNNLQVSIRDLDEDNRFTELFNNTQDRYAIEIPLLSKGVVLGVMVLVTNPSQSVSERVLRILSVVGREIGVALDNAMLLSESRRREQEAVTLYKLGTKISASLELDHLLHAVAGAASDLLDTDIGMVGLLDENKKEIVVEASVGDVSGIVDGIRLPLSGESFLDVLKEGKPIIADHSNLSREFLHNDELSDDEHIASYLAVPLIHGENFLGLIEVMTKKRRLFLQRDAQLLMRLAHHVVVSIENAQLYQQLRFLATLEERDRLAGEMHDHLAQALGYLNVKASITCDLLANGQVDQAKESLQELKKAAKIVYKDVREVIFNLRTEVSSPTDFFTTLEGYLNDYKEHYGVNASLEIADRDVVSFSPVVASQLLRIIQEALTNVRKHAGANKAWIRFDQTDDKAIIDIEDDGKGFDSSLITRHSRQCFGVKIMHERAESVGGRLKLYSQPGQGTRITVSLPLNPNNERLKRDVENSASGRSRFVS